MVLYRFHSSVFRVLRPICIFSCMYSQEYCWQLCRLAFSWNHFPWVSYLSKKSLSSLTLLLLLLSIFCNTQNREILQCTTSPVLDATDADGKYYLRFIKPSSLQPKTLKALNVSSVCSWKPPLTEISHSFVVTLEYQWFLHAPFAHSNKFQSF